MCNVLCRSVFIIDCNLDNFSAVGAVSYVPHPAVTRDKPRLLPPNPSRGPHGHVTPHRRGLRRHDDFRETRGYCRQHSHRRSQ